MAEFFLSIPGAVATVSLGILLLTRPIRPRMGAARGQDAARPIMQIVVSAVLLAAGLWVMLSGNYGADAMHWASGAIGTVVGYWLKP
jgi:hypothetical protein